MHSDLTRQSYDLLRYNAGACNFWIMQLALRPGKCWLTVKDMYLRADAVRQGPIIDERIMQIGRHGDIEPECGAARRLLSLD